MCSYLIFNTLQKVSKNSQAWLPMLFTEDFMIWVYYKKSLEVLLLRNVKKTAIVEYHYVLYLSCPLKLTLQVLSGSITSNLSPPAVKELGSVLLIAVSGWTGCCRCPTPGISRCSQISALRSGLRPTRMARLGPSWL